MPKVRVLVFLSTIIIVGVVGVFASYFARGYRLNLNALFTKGAIKFQPNGILVIKSEPDGASVYVDGELKTATNATLSLSPGTYDVEVKKEGYLTWYKRLTIEKEIVTQATVSLFNSVPSLAPITLNGAANPIASLDGSRIAYAILPSKENGTDKIGLYTLETLNLPLGFANNPKRITDGDLTEATFAFSPDSREIMLTTSKGVYILDSGSFTSQNQRVNVESRKESILSTWKKELKDRNSRLVNSLPPELTDILLNKSIGYTFSPDDNMILYTASSSASLSENLIPQLPGASTQKQQRQIETGQTYVYDIKEDRNFLITDQNEVTRWLPSSRHIILPEEGRVVIMEYDGTNRQVVYSGSYISPNAFPFTNAAKLVILTNLGGDSTAPNLYTLTVK